MYLYDLETSQRPQRDKTKRDKTKRDKGTDTRRKSSISSPAKPDIKKLRQKANLVNETKDQEISSEKKKSRLTKVNQAKEKLADADLSIKSRVLKNLDGAEDFKKKGIDIFCTGLFCNVLCCTTLHCRGGVKRGVAAPSSGEP